MKNLKNLEKKLGIAFNNNRLLTEALVHRSYLNEIETLGLNSNERLEFLGDSILSLVISEWIFEEFPNYPEGNLTNLRSNLVKTGALAKIAKKFGLGEYLFLSKGEEKSGGRENLVLLANSLEAIIGAIYLDQGLMVAKDFIRNNFRPALKKLVKLGELKDYKSLLQEKLQSETKHSPVYKTLKTEGPDHAKIFTIGVYLRGKLQALGKGKSKQTAEKEAARIALEK